MSLVFSKNQVPETFTNSSVTQFNDKNEDALLRELIQNSLDARQSDIPVKVSFSRRTVNRDEVPELDALEKALDAAIDYNSNESQTQKIASKIKRSHYSDEVDLLIIRDNGIGLNRNRMNDILLDGASKKDESSAGSYGNGHITTFKFSDFLYIIYVGVSCEGPLVAGHTILASHKDENGLNGKDGFLVKYIPDNMAKGEQDNGIRFEFLDIEEIDSPLIRQTLSEIQTETKFGSAVIITAFDINTDENLAEKIERLSALHFFPAIADDELNVAYTSANGDAVEVNAENVEKILSKYSSEKRNRKMPGGPTGDKTYEAFKTYTPRQSISLSTSLCGNIDCFLRSSEVSQQNINLFRKGMWISQSIRELGKRHFAIFAPFDLVINVKYESSPELYELIKSSEGSLHMDLHERSGYEEEWKKLKQFWKEFREALKPYLKETNFDEFTPNDFGLIDVDDNNNHPDNQGNSPVQKWQRSIRPPDDTPPPPPDEKNYFNIFGDAADINGQARRPTPDQLVAQIIPNNDVFLPELRIAEVLGADATCDLSGDIRLSDLQYCEIEEIIIDGKSYDFQIDGRGIRKKPNSDGLPSGVFAIKLQEFTANNTLNFLIKFKPNLRDPRSSMRLDIVDRTREMETKSAS